MTTHHATRAKFTIIAYFPEHFFLENLAVRADGSILITVLKHRQLWYVPTPDADLPVDPVLVHTFDSAAMGIVEAEPASSMSARSARPPWSGSTCATGAPVRRPTSPGC